MNRLVRIIGALVLAGILLGATLVVVIEFGSRRSLREVKHIVAELAPGTPFSQVLQQLGSATHSHTNVEDIAAFGTRREGSLITNSTLHQFAHRGPPYPDFRYWGRG
jgi:HAMP domain-containing protein